MNAIARALNAMYAINIVFWLGGKVMPVSDGCLSGRCLTMLLHYERFIIFHGAVGPPRAIIMRLQQKLAWFITDHALCVRSFEILWMWFGSTSDARLMIFSLHRRRFIYLFLSKLNIIFFILWYCGMCREKLICDLRVALTIYFLLISVIIMITTCLRGMGERTKNVIKTALLRKSSFNTLPWQCRNQRRRKGKRREGNGLYLVWAVFSHN